MTMHQVMLKLTRKSYKFILLLLPLSQLSKTFVQSFVLFTIFPFQWTIQQGPQIMEWLKGFQKFWHASTNHASTVFRNNRKAFSNQMFFPSLSQIVWFVFSSSLKRGICMLSTGWPDWRFNQIYCTLQRSTNLVPLAFEFVYSELNFRWDVRIFTQFTVKVSDKVFGCVSSCKTLL